MGKVGDRKGAKEKRVNRSFPIYHSQSKHINNEKSLYLTKGEECQKDVMESLQHFKLYFKSRSLSTSHVHCLQQNWVPLKSMSLYHHRTSSFRFHTCDLSSWQGFIFRTQLWCIKLGGNLRQCVCVSPSNLRGDWGILAVPTLFFRCQEKKRNTKHTNKHKIALCTV